MAEGLAVALVERRRGAAPKLAECAWIERRPEPRALRGELQRLKLLRTGCNALLDAEHYQLLLVEAPRVEPAELRAAIRWRVKDLVDYHIDDAVFDVFEIPGQRQLANRQSMMYAVVARAAAVRARVELLSDAGVQLQSVDIPEMALRNLAALTEEDAHGALMVQLGERSGLLAVTRQQHLYLARRIEVGAAALRDAAAAREGGEAADIAPGTLLGDMLDGIVLEIQRSVDYYDRHFGQPPLAGIVLAPPGPGLAGIEAYLARRLGLPVRRLDLNQVLETARPLDPQQQARCLLAIGAALRHEEAVL